MKRFWLFAGTGQPKGGMGDFQTGAQQPKALLTWLEKNATNETVQGIPFVWFEIVDVTTNTVKVRGHRAFTSDSAIEKGVDYYTYDTSKGRWTKLKNKPSS
tara:strand:- start:50351 stop:50653 length:303 start_codon:yes stop_codon:yes gene_type:complete